MGCTTSKVASSDTPQVLAPKKLEDDDSNAAGEILDVVQGYIESAGGLKENVEGVATAADKLTELLKSEQQPMAIKVLGECSDVASKACSSIAPALAFVAPALILVGVVLKQVSVCVSIPSVVAALARKLAALRPILKATAKSESLARTHANLLNVITSELESASNVISKATSHNRIMGFIKAG
jgi:hypothetical protein